MNRKKKMLTAILIGSLLVTFTACSMATEQKQSADISGGNGEQSNLVTQGTEQQGADSNLNIKADYSEYDNLISKIAEGVKTGLQIEDIEQLGVSEAFLMAKESKRFGYARMDVDGNGIEELLLGESGEGEESDVIYNVYTLTDGKLVPVVQGWERNRYYLCENSILANEGSNGAGNSVYAYYTYSETELSLKEAVLFDYTIDEANPWFYSNQSLDVQKAEKIKEDQALQIMDFYRYQTVGYTIFE